MVFAACGSEQRLGVFVEHIFDSRVRLPNLTILWVFRPADLETDRDDPGLFMWPCAREEGIHNRGDLSLHCFMWVVEHSQSVID